MENFWAMINVEKIEIRVMKPHDAISVIYPHFLELKWAYGCPFNYAWCYLKGTFRFQKTKTKPVFKDREKVRLHTEAFLMTHSKEVLNTGVIAEYY